MGFPVVTNEHVSLLMGLTIYLLRISLSVQYCELIKNNLDVSLYLKQVILLVEQVGLVLLCSFMGAYS